MDDAVFADIRAIVAGEGVQSGQRPSPRIIEAASQATVQFGQARTAAARRQAVEALLRDPSTVALSDREIARSTGVSPSTVGSIRRRLAHP